MKETKILIALLLLCILSSDTWAAGPQGRRSPDVMVNVYNRGGGTPYGYSGYPYRAGGDYYNSGYPQFYYGRLPRLSWRSPVRYHLPWNRPKVEVTVNETKGTLFFRPIPKVTFIEPERKAPELTQPMSFIPREEFLIEAVLRRNRTDRILAARELGNYRKITAVAVLGTVLINDYHPEVRVEAARSLGKIALPPAYEILVRSEASEVDPSVRAAVSEAKKTLEDTKVEIRVLGDIPAFQHGTQRIKVYLEDLRYGKAESREEAVQKLSKYQDTRVVAALMSVLINDPDKHVRKEAARSLGRIEDRMALPYLEAAQAHDVEETVRKESQRAIETITE